MIEPGFLPILFAAVAALVVGAAWYHPKVFGASWIALSGIDSGRRELMEKRMPLLMLAALFALMLVAYVMSYFGMAWGVVDWIGAIELGFWCWIGFAAPPMLAVVNSVGRPFKLFVLHALYWLVALVVMAQVLLFA